MYLSKQLTTRSLPEIGRKFGGRDHTTVIHAVRKIEQLREEDPALRRGCRFAAADAGKLAFIPRKNETNLPVSGAFLVCF